MNLTTVLLLMVFHILALISIIPSSDPHHVHGRSRSRDGSLALPDVLPPQRAYHLIPWASVAHTRSSSCSPYVIALMIDVNCFSQTPLPKSWYHYRRGCSTWLSGGPMISSCMEEEAIYGVGQWSTVVGEASSIPLHLLERQSTHPTTDAHATARASIQCLSQFLFFRYS